MSDAYQVVPMHCTAQLSQTGFRTSCIAGSGNGVRGSVILVLQNLRTAVLTGKLFLHANSTLYDHWLGGPETIKPAL